jgi:hypothetical protein
VSMRKNKWPRIKIDKVVIEAIPVQDMPGSVGYLRFEKDGNYMCSIDCKRLETLRWLKKQIDLAIETSAKVSE